MKTLPILPAEIWNTILNHKRRMEYDDRWGWRKEIDLSKCVHLRDYQRWWVGNHRLPTYRDWPDLDRAWFIYYLKYIVRVRLDSDGGMADRCPKDTVCSGTGNDTMAFSVEELEMSLCHYRITNIQWCWMTGNVIVTIYKNNTQYISWNSVGPLYLDHSWIYKDDPFYTHFNNRFALLNEIIQTAKKLENDSL